MSSQGCHLTAGNRQFRVVPSVVRWYGLEDWRMEGRMGGLVNKARAVDDEHSALPFSIRNAPRTKKVQIPRPSAFRPMNRA
jgi:hypothetical protein